MHDRNAGTAGDEPGQIRQIGGDDQYGRHLISRFRLLRLRYRCRTRRNLDRNRDPDLHDLRPAG